MTGMVGYLLRGALFAVGMMAVSFAGSWIWMRYWTSEIKAITAGPPGTPTERLRGQIEAEIAYYNERLAQISTPDIEARGMELNDRSIVTRFMVNRFTAPGARNETFTRLRQRHFTQVCGSRRLVLREGYRFVFSYADIVGGEMRIAISAADCEGRP